MSTDIIAPLTAEDQAVLWEMLYHAIYVPPGQAPPPRDIVRRPELAKYAQDWGRTGDLGVKAVHIQTQEPMGAAWLRLFVGRHSGYGYLDDETPELSIAILPAYRGQGVGTRLLGAMLHNARAHYAAVSLSVSSENPAARLYRRYGFETVRQDGPSLTMRKVF